MKAIIVGAGIAGITTALGLQKQGIDFELVESYNSLNAYGAGIWLAPNALQVLEKLDTDLLNEIRSNGKTVDRFGVTDYKGSMISVLDMQELEDELGYRHVTIHRQKLIEILASYLKKPILFNKAYESHEKLGVGVGVTFRDGSTMKGDFLIACDGIGSVVRQRNFAKAEERFSGQTCWRAIINHQVPPSYKGCFYEMWDSKNGTRVGHAPISDGQVYMFITSKERKSVSDTKIKKDYLTEKVKDYAFDIKKAIEVSNEEDWLCHELSDFKPLDKWFSDDVVLVGDAAHAMTPNMGQGGNQAIESAYCLALQLAENKRLIDSFDSYQTIRKTRVDEIVSSSWRLGQFVNMRYGILKKLMIWIMKKMPKRILMKQSMKQYTPIV